MALYKSQSVYVTPPKKCFICYGDGNLDSTFNYSSSKCLDKQLLVFFVLRKVIGLTADIFKTYLRKNGNPDEWISLCDGCMETINYVKKTYSEYMKISKKYEEARLIILDKIKKTGSGVKGRKSLTNKSHDVTEECRALIRKRKLFSLVSIPSSQTSFQLWDGYADKLVAGGGKRIKMEEATIVPFARVKKELDESEIHLLSMENESEGQGHFQLPFAEDRFNDEDDQSMSDSVGGYDDDYRDDDFNPDYYLSKTLKSKSKNGKKRVASSSRVSRIRNRSITSEHHVETSQADENEDEEAEEDEEGEILTDSTVYSCNLCDLNNTSKKNLQGLESFVSHIFYKHQILYQCLACSKGFATLEQRIGRHWSSKHQDIIKNYPTEYKYRVKKLDTEPELPAVQWRCPYCSLEFDDENKRDSHEISCNISAPDSERISRVFKCVGCEKSFFTLAEERIHKVLRHPDLFAQETPNQCDVCHSYFDSKTTLMEHKSSKHGIGAEMLKCDVCEAQFKVYKSLVNHKFKAHNILTESFDFPCNMCKQVFNSELNLKFHLERSENHIKEKCKVCGMQLGTMSELRKHSLDFHGTDCRDYLHKCDVPGCNRAYESSYELKRHKKSHDQIISKVICDVCGRTLRSQKALMEHKFIVHKIDPPGEQKIAYHECELCKRRFRYAEFLKEHSAVCKAKKVFNCELCQDAFKTPEELIAHKRFKHSVAVSLDDVELMQKQVEEREKFPCAHCGKLFPTTKSLTHHEKMTHELNDRFACIVESCDFKTATQEGVEIHQAKMHQIGVDLFKCRNCQVFCKTKAAKRRHVCGVEDSVKLRSVPKKFICTVCGKEYANKSGRDTHFRTAHEGKRKYHCEHCETFSTNSRKDLTRHLAALHNIGDWKCEVSDCGKVFYCEKKLQEHMNHVHFGLPRPKLICPLCGKHFSGANVLTTHMQIVHSDKKPYECEWCGEAFKTAQYRFIHKKKCLNKPVTQSEIQCKSDERV